MKCKTVIIAILILISLTASAFTVQAAPKRTVYGKVYIDGEIAPNDIVTVELTIPYPPDVKTNTTYENGDYSFNFEGDNYELCTFRVQYNGTWYTPTPSSFELDDEHVLLYNVDLNVDTTSPENNPPDAPTLVAPSDGSTVGGTTSATLQVSVSDPNGDPMDVSFYNNDGGTLLGTSSGVASGSTASYSWTGLSANTGYSWYATANDSEFTTQSSTWSFTTAKSGGDPPPPPPGGNGGSNGGYTGPTYTEPSADANGPYIEYYDFQLGYGEVVFDGSDSTGSIDIYTWDFGDGTTGTGVSPTHQYTSMNNFTVTLNVTGPLGYNVSTTYALITPEANTPPTAPTVSGPQTGTVDTDYKYTAVATDDDPGDQIKYIFDWGDGTTTTTDFFDNNTAVNETHNWSAAGVYKLKVSASDNATETPSDDYYVLIDAIWVKTIGYMMDTDGDGTYDTFYSNETGEVTDVEEQTDGTYYIDSDGTEGWDWVYDPSTDTLTEYSAGETPPAEDNTLLYVGAIILILIILGLLWMLGKKKGKKPEEKKPETKKKAKK